MSISTVSVLNSSEAPNSEVTVNVATVGIAPTDTAGSHLPLYQTLGQPVSTTINQFLSRPVQLYSGTAVGTITLPDERKLATDFFALDSVAQKLKFSRLVRGTFRVRIVLRTGPYAFGQLVASTHYGTFAQISAGDLNSVLGAYQATTRTHVILDASTQNEAVLDIPLRSKYPYATVSATDPYADLLCFVIHSLTNMVDASTGADAVFDYKVYVSLIDTEICVPVIHDSGAIYTADEISETRLGPISFPASIVANLARQAKKFGIWPRFAYATEIAATGVGQIAKIFGFSRPRELDPQPPGNALDFSSSVGEVRSKWLTQDPYQEVPIDNSFLGESGDALLFSNTIERPSVLGVFEWKSIDLPGHMVLQIPVTPSSTGAYDPTEEAYALSPLAYFSQMYKLWRGDIVYKICIPTNRYIRGQVRVFWSPVILNGAFTPDVLFQDITQNAPGVLIDLSTQSEVTVTVPWATREPYLPVYMPNILMEDIRFANGWLYMIVEQPIIAASAIDLSVVVWVSAAPGFQLHIPTQRHLQFIRRQIYDPDYNSAITILPVGAGSIPTPEIDPGAPDLAETENFYQYTALEKEWYVVDTAASTSLEPLMELKVSLLPEAEGHMAQVNCMGEATSSFRPLLKRFCPYARIAPVTLTSSMDGYSTFLPYMPQEPMFSRPVATTYYPPMLLTYQRYVSNCWFGIRGSMRYSIKPLHTTGSFMASIRRGFAAPFSYVLNNVSTAATQISNLFSMAEQGTGVAFYNSVSGSMEPIVVDVPWQCVSQYADTRITDPGLTGTRYGVFVTFYGQSLTSPSQVHCSTGEDFMPVIWNGVPLVSIYPPGTATIESLDYVEPDTEE